MDTETAVKEGLLNLRETVNNTVNEIRDLDYRGTGGRELALVITKLQEARLWAGQALKEMGYYEEN